MKVIFSVEPIRHPLTGIGRYAFELAKRLPKHPDIDQIRWFSRNRFLVAIPDPSIRAGENVRAGARKAGNFLARYDFFRRVQSLSARAGQFRALGQTKGWLYHGPNFYLPAARGPAVVTFHDLSILKYPQFHPEGRVQFMRKEILLALKRATVIITDTEFIRQEIADYFAFPLERIRAVHLAGGEDFFPRPETETNPALAALKLSHGNYTLYTGTMEPRKNLIRLMDAYGKLEPALRRRFPLIMVGYAGWNNDAIMARVRQAEREGWARYMGYVSNDLLPTLFSGARLFVLPSTYEGFGLPVLEAMASGTPVVCSNSSCLPEIAGHAAAMCAPEDVDHLAQLLKQGLEDESWRESAVAEGLLQARKFSWERCAGETVEAYQLAWRMFG